MKTRSKAEFIKANPWGLTPSMAKSMEAVNKTGNNKLAARLLGLEAISVEQNVLRARDQMGHEYRLLALLEFDRWLQADSKRTANGGERTSPP